MLPLPSKIVLHDLWIFLFSITNFKVGYLDKVCMLYRRHDETVTYAGKKKSNNSFWFRVKFRLYAVGHLLYRTCCYQINK